MVIYVSKNSADKNGHAFISLSLATHKCSREVGNLNGRHEADAFLHKLAYISQARVESKKNLTTFSPIKRQIKPRERVVWRKMKG